jgi:hypothetical protein
MLSGNQIAMNLMLTFVFCLIMAVCVGLAAKNAQLQQQNGFLQERVPVDNETLDKKFTAIYESLEVIAQRQRVIADTHLRTQHYVKPHTSYQDLCPECGDLWGKKKKDIVFVPVDRLAELREAERVSLGGVFTPFSVEEEEAEPPIDIAEELDSVLQLLKAYESYSYTLMQTETYTNHYAKKHDHLIPGLQGFGNCPDCIALRSKQVTPTQPISKSRYDYLLRIETGAQSNER